MQFRVQFSFSHLGLFILYLEYVVLYMILVSIARVRKNPGSFVLQASGIGADDGT
nr:MAG TPA: hypothetical protein [Caudoviricetes sp.]